MTEEVRIPDIGDIDEVEVIEICVAAGDRVEPEDALIVIESDKASMEVPAGRSGTVASVHVAVGDQVGEGALVVTLEPPAEAAERTPADTGADAAADLSAAGDGPEDQAAETAPAAGAASPVAVPDSAGTVREAGGTVEVRVPDIGDAGDVVVIEVAVREGDSVQPDDLLVVVESDKASMEIPAGVAGTVAGVHVAEGSQVLEGTLLATIRTDAAATAGGPSPTTDAPPGDTAAATPASGTSGHDQEEAPSAAVPAQAPLPGPESGPERAAAPADARDRKVYAGPAVRRLARELGVVLAQVKGTGERGRIRKEDVKAHVKAAMTRKPAETGGGIPPVPAVDFSRFGPIELAPLSRIRRSGAANLQRSWLNVPHVTQFEEADVTELEAFRQTLKEEAARRQTKITPLAFIIKACCYALQEFPTFNASLDPEGANYVLKKYYHIGFAVDTQDGLVVPVIRDADRMGVWDLSEAIASLAGKARSGSMGLSDMQGGSFSISSLGNIGGTGFTPIINAPEVAILGVSRLATRPVWNGAAFEPRQMLPLSLSYDHRAINGAEAGRFLAVLAELLGDIRRLAL